MALCAAAWTGGQIGANLDVLAWQIMGWGGCGIVPCFLLLGRVCGVYCTHVQKSTDLFLETFYYYYLLPAYISEPPHQEYSVITRGIMRLCRKSLWQYIFYLSHTHMLILVYIYSSYSTHILRVFYFDDSKIARLHDRRTKVLSNFIFL